jgi:hypothetical protein
LKSFVFYIVALASVDDVNDGKQVVVVCTPAEINFIVDSFISGSVIVFNSAEVFVEAVVGASLGDVVLKCL